MGTTVLSMDGLSTRWLLRDEASLQKDAGRVALRERLLQLRTGSTDIDSLGVGWDRLEGPESLPGAVEAGELLAQAIGQGRRIAIFGDYDVDGITASILLRSLILAIDPSAEVPIRLPNRLEEGYGLNTKGLLELRERGVDLVVTVDCGITSVEEVAEAKAAGLEMILSDHHDFRMDEQGRIELPDADVVVHPRLPGAEGFPSLAGCGVAFKIGWAMLKAHCGSEKLPSVLKEALVHALPFAAMGTIADVVPLVEENRVLAAQGLRMASRTNNVGLKALLRACQRSETVDEEVIKFQLAPRINALGRLGSAMEAIELFSTSDPEVAAAISARMTEVNDQRKKSQEALVEHACRRVEEEGQDQDDHPVIVLAEPGWQQGLCGPSAAKVLDRYHRPVVLLEVCDDGMARGSARSIQGYSIREGLDSCSELLERFGGHAAAAGLTLPVERVDELRKALVEHARAHIDPKDLQPLLEVDCRASLGEVGSLDELKRMRELAPFGQGNPEPKVLVEGVRAIQHRWIGSDSNHLKMTVIRADAPRDARPVDAIWFRAGIWRDEINEAIRKGPIDLVVEPGINVFNGSVNAQMKISDLRGEVHQDSEQH